MANITTTLTNAENRAQRGVSKSDLDLIHKSPALLEWKKNAPREESEVAITGTALHAAVLEPEAFAAEYIKRPSFDLRTKDGKAALVAGVNGSATGKVKAGELLAHVASLTGGKGGGRPDLAQGGGEDGPALVSALQAVPDWVAERLK